VAIPFLWCLIAAALFGAATPISKLLLGGLGPFTLAGALYIGAGIALLPAAVRGRSRTRAINGRNLALVTGVVGFGGILAPVFLLYGLSQAPAGSVALWLNFEPVATALLAWVMFREHVTRHSWLAVLLVLASGTLLAQPFTWGSLEAASLVTLACVCWGLDNNFTALVDAFTPAQTTSIKGILAGSVNLAIGSWFEAGLGSLQVAALALSIGALCFGLSLVLYIAGAQQLGAIRSQLLFATSPFYGLVLAWTALGEPVLWTQIAAAGLAILSIWLLYSERHGHAHTHESVTHLHSHRHDDGHHDHARHDHQHAGLTASVWHTHEHTHESVTHTHPHRPDLHHRHTH